MKRIVLFAVPVFILFAALFLGGYAHAKHKHAPPWARTIDPIVSTEWLEKNLYGKNLVILDVRSFDDYAAGHIPGSINEPFVTDVGTCWIWDVIPNPISNWITESVDCLWLELPDEADLFNTIGSLGITHDSRVVIVSDPSPLDPAPHYGLSAATRVADTLIYAGVKKVAILDGGYAKWAEDGLPTTMDDEPAVNPVTYRGKVNEAMFVSIEYVKENIEDLIIIDARDADVYFGVTIEPFADKAGHIPSAKSLPAPWIWDINPDGTYTYKDYEALNTIASRAICGPCGYKGHGDQEIIVYCGVGGYASSWWFVLTQVLGYKNVKFYDGSAQEWVRSDDMVPYQCE